MSRIDELTEQLLEGKPVVGTTRYHKDCNLLMGEYLRLIEDDDPRSFGKALKLKARLRTAVIRLAYRPSAEGGMNPKQASVEEMRYAISNPLIHVTQHRDHKKQVITEFMYLDNLSKEQLARVDSPIKGIRAKCMDCQGNDSTGVRECACINCPLWPFRMGTNVFYGRLAASEAELSDAEVAAEEQEINAIEEDNGNPA